MRTRAAALAFPKPERRSKVRKRVTRQRQLSRAACRLRVLARDKSACRYCGQPVTDNCEPHRPERAHVHEVQLRSLGGDPRDPGNCLTLCHTCHLGLVHGKKLRIEGSDAKHVRFVRVR